SSMNSSTRSQPVPGSKSHSRRKTSGKRSGRSKRSRRVKVAMGGPPASLPCGSPHTASPSRPHGRTTHRIPRLRPSTLAAGTVGGHPGGMGRIIVGVDGSRNSAAALRWAVAEGRLRDLAVTAVYVWGYYDPPAADDG